MDDDMISGLPEHVKHHILSFIPSIKEVARTSSLSKSWLLTWRSFPIADFFVWEILPVAAFGEFRETDTLDDHYCDLFIKFVDDALLRSRDGMPRFRLVVTAEMAPHVDRWLGMALDCRPHVLDIKFLNQFSGNLPYLIPGRVLSAEFIKSLTLSGEIKIDGKSPVRLPALQSLVFLSFYIDNEMFHRLIAGCPLLEYLFLRSGSLLSEIRVSNLSYLKRVILIRSSPELKLVSIKAPGLESFSFESKYIFEHDVGLVIDVSPSISWLELSRLYQTDKWFYRVLSRLPLLQSLSLFRCGLLKRILITNPLLEELTIVHCHDLVSIGIDAPKLSFFFYETSTTWPFIWMKNPLYDCAVGFIFRSLQEPGAVWFQELQEFLARCSTNFRCSESNIFLHEWHEYMEDELPKQVFTSAPGILNLKFELVVSKSSYPLILDGIFSACRPSNFLVRASYSFLKFICDTLANYEENLDCCSGETQCWKHKLKNVKIERLEGIQHQETLDWCTVFSLLPTLSAFAEVRLRLEW